MLDCLSGSIALDAGPQTLAPYTDALTRAGTTAAEDLRNRGLDVRVFRDRDEALAWLTA